MKMQKKIEHRATFIKPEGAKDIGPPGTGFLRCADHPEAPVKVLVLEFSVSVFCDRCDAWGRDSALMSFFFE